MTVVNHMLHAMSSKQNFFILSMDLCSNAKKYLPVFFAARGGKKLGPLLGGIFGRLPPPKNIFPKAARKHA